jgi:hypothetical protein
MSASRGTVVEALDYYPHGSTRISQTTGGFNGQKQYFGQYEDPETNLSYLQARCNDGGKREFLSDDRSLTSREGCSIAAITPRHDGRRWRSDV